ncbi:Vacuolar protein sorting-associated protein vts1 [Colletotrichum tanaceti]|nr:Vacuolar protein sorting-associated protein vts1 [Colletotrichum tanaceti]
MPAHVGSDTRRSVRLPISGVIQVSRRILLTDLLCARELLLLFTFSLPPFSSPPLSPTHPHHRQPFSLPENHGPSVAAAMAEPIPSSLRQADITRFINRANQLRQHMPVITYWCEYWIVNQILAKGLHNADDESLSYTTNLMDRLEQTKTENAQEEAIVDDAVGQAYVEQFAQESFERAEKVLRANRVTRQTADTYDAAATFLLLGNIWGAIDEETQKKVKP